MTETRRLKGICAALAIAQALIGCATEAQIGPDGALGDAKITADVRAAIDRHPDLGSPNRIYVNCRKNVVYLSGSANTELTIANAEALAHELPGVTRVVSTVGVEE
jgi:osmotically-inducible protein OsmY